MELYLTEIKVADWAGVVRWYRDTLGLRLVLEDAEHGYALFQAGASRLGVAQGDAAPPSAVRLMFRVEELDAERERLRAAGVTVGEPFEHAAEHFRAVRMEDPCGTPITLFAWTEGVGGGGREGRADRDPLSG